MNRAHRLVALVILAVSFASNSFASGKVRVVVSVDWEGRDLGKYNLQAMSRFRTEHPDIPLQHFLNPAYYTKPGAKAGEVTKAIRSVLRPGDEHGMHIHAWRSLIEAAGVPFRTTPSFVRDDIDLSRCFPDCGHDIALTAYTEAELRQIFRYGVDVLKGAGFDRPRGFRAGGWQADNTVLRALALEGFSLDSSGTDAAYLYDSWSLYNLYGFVAKLWPDMTPESQPYTWTSEPGVQLTELPNNGCLADYMTAAATLEAFEKIAALWHQSPDDTFYLSIGFHQETASTYLPTFALGIKLIEAYAKKQRIPFEYVTGVGLEE